MEFQEAPVTSGGNRAIVFHPSPERRTVDDQPAIDRLGDDQLRKARASTMAYASELDYDGYINAFGRRATILCEWLLFLDRFPLLLMPVSSLRPVPLDYDQEGDAAVARMLTSHHPMLGISMLGLPALAAPTGQPTAYLLECN